MKALYMDNYRGFSDQLVMLRDVNFFVGENSSGKTSLLAAVKLLSSSEFWTSRGLPSVDLPFTAFSDFVSRTSRRRHFTLGLSSTKGGSVADFRLIKFGESHGVPVARKFSFICAGLIVIVNIGQRITYRTIPVGSHKLEDVVAQSKVALHATTADVKRMELSPQKTLDVPSEVLRRFGLVMLQYFVMEQLRQVDVVTEKDTEAALAMNSTICRWIAPIRAKPQRIYFEHSSSYSPEGVHVPYYLSDLLDDADVDADGTLERVNKFGVASGLFDKIAIKKYGAGGLEPFEINIHRNGVVTQINNVGYGVSQVLPVLIEACRAKRNCFVSIQQPEVHLHPKAQAALGGLIHDVSRDRRTKFLIETHSDFVVDRFRLAQNSSEQKVDAQVVFMERKEGKCSVVSLPIDEFGGYPEVQPSGFRDFFLNEELALIRM